MGLPYLPPDVLELIWDYVRMDLRPRMRTKLKHDVRMRAAVYIARTHGTWLYNAYTLMLGDVSHASMVMCAWEHMYLPGVSMDHIPRNMVRNAHMLYKLMPEPFIDQCRPTGLHYGPPDWSRLKLLA